MKKFLAFIFAGVSCFAADSVMVDDDGVLLWPEAEDFTQANSIASVQWVQANFDGLRADLRVSVDMSPSPQNSASTSARIYAWSDFEGKLIDKWNNIIYYTATIALNNQQVAKLHPELTDKTCEIFYWTTNNSGTGTNGCYGQKKQLTNFNSSIGAINSGHGTLAVWIYPSISSTETRTVPVYTGPGQYTMKQVVWGEYIREIFSDPENTFVAWRQTTTQGEMYNNERVWRPQRIEWIGDRYENK